MDLVNRIKLLEAAHADEEAQQVLIARCQIDILFWFNTFCWTFDPRSDGMVPFILYPFQEWFVEEAYGCIERGEDFGIEKCRDVGTSWMLMLIFQYGWLYRPGWHFLAGSRKEDAVCNANDDPDTLLGKFRLNLKRLPWWMRPGYSDKHLSIKNLDNGNFIKGESSNPYFGRGGRNKAVLFDEMAFDPSAGISWGGCARNTNCRIANSTPFGMTNKFGLLMNDPSIQPVYWPGLEAEMMRKGLKGEKIHHSVGSPPTLGSGLV